MNHFIDFEFTSSSELNVDVVCAVLQATEGPFTHYWMFRNDNAKDNFRNKMKEIEGQTLIAFGALAECRALRSLGIDPLKYKWIDLYTEWRQLKNHNDRFNFGWVKNSSGEIVLSKPHSQHHDCHIETGYSLADCVLHLLKIDINTDHKNQMRDLILSKHGESSTFSSEEQDSVVRYCTDDVNYLSAVYSKMIGFYKRFFESDRCDVMTQRGRFIAALSKCEHIGTPIDMNALENLANNHVDILKEVYTSMNKEFLLYEQKDDQNFSFKTSRFKELIQTLNLKNDWPKTESGYFTTDTDTIQKFRHIPVIEKLHQTKKIISSMRTIKGDSRDKLTSRIGRDNRLRSFFGPFGTQTGRNAAKASNFILAMSNWLRVLITPPTGQAITSIDYSSQEFAIAAALSGDGNMKEAYKSGDPYLYFGKKAGAIPTDGTKETYKKERDLFKSTTLGLQYGMAARSLSKKLTQDIGRPISENDSAELIELHQRVYPDFWMWSEYCWKKYLRDGCLETTDGWVLFGNNQNTLSVKNFLVQGTGASIMRRALILATESDLEVIAPLHDAIYILHPETDSQSVATLNQCMHAASSEIVNIEVRTDAKTYHHGDPWVEDKGRSDYERFKRFLK